MSTKDLQTKLKELKELQRLSEELATEITSIQDEIKAEMLSRHTDELTAGEYKVRWKEVISKRFDSTAFKAMHSDLYSQFVRQTTSKRFTIA